MRAQGKRAVSPLIATVLLIAFCVSLGAVVIQWGSGYVRDRTDETSARSKLDLTCSQDAFLDVVQYNDVEQLCYNGSSLVTVLENGPYVQIDSFAVYVIGNTSVAKLNITNSTLQKSEVRRFEIAFSDPPAKQVRFIPAVSVNGVSVQCPRSALVRDDLTMCT